MVNIVVAVDESEESMRACEWACKHLLAAQTDIQHSCNFILLHVQPTPCVSTGPASAVQSIIYGLRLSAATCFEVIVQWIEVILIETRWFKTNPWRTLYCINCAAYVPSNQVFELLELQTKRTTQRILKRALNICDRYGVKAETHVVTGEAKERICEAAAKLGAHFLVVGSHGHGAFIRAMRGSVSDYCARNAACPVVVVNRKVFSG